MRFADEGVSMGRELSKKKFKRGITHRLLTYVKPYGGYVVGAIIFSILYVAFVLVGPVLSGWAIDAMFEEGELFEKVWILVVGFALCVLLASLSQKLLGNCVNSLCYKLVKDLRRDAFQSLTGSRIKYIDSHAQGDVMARVVTDVDIVSDGLLQGVAQLFTGVMTILATLVVMFVINYLIALVVVVLTPLSLFVAAFITKRTFKSFTKQVRVQGELAAHVKEMLGGQKTVILFNEERASCDKFDEIDARLYDIGWRAQYYSALTNPSTRFVNAVIYAVVGVLGAIFCILSAESGGVLQLGALTLSGFTVGMLSVFLSYANQYTKPFNEISNVITQLQNAFASAARVFEVVDEPGEKLDGENRIEKVRGNIRIENACFSYDPSRKLIENLNVDVKAGSKIAIVGPTGCGKTTLINLLMRFYDLDSGTIYVDGVNAKTIPLDEYRKMFGMVLQESFLAGETVAWNIAYGNEDASREQVETAAKAAYCDFFIRNLEKGYDTVLTGNVNISQGERQLLCIARVMLADPPMLILDEATSNIDTMTEMRIQKAFKKIMQGRTSFIVAHRLSTILDADLILVMKDGSVIEQGTHEQLMEKKGFYYNLYNSQFAQ